MIPPPSPFLINEHFSSRVVPPDGTGSSKIMVIAEASGRHEDQALIPLHPKADAGSVFAKVLRRCGVSRDSLTLTNVCWQRPPNNELESCSYELEAVSYFRPFNEALIAERRPKVIILTGNVPLRTFTDFGRDEGQMITQLANYTVPATIAGHDTLLLFSLHPSFILHGQQAFTQVLIWTIQRAFQLVKEGLNPQPTRYVPTPCLDDMLAFERGFNPERDFLAFDIETPESGKLDEEEVEDKEEDISYQIIRISLCYDEEAGYAISMPWNAPFIEVVKRMLERAQRLECWNQVFDCPRLRHAGVRFTGRIYDRMQCLAGTTKVRICGGKSKTIKEIVDNRLNVSVITMDETGKVLPTSITAWHKNPAIDKKWLRIRTASSRQPIYCTDDHKIWTRSGEVEAKSLVVGMQVPSPNLGSDDLIHGTILGDAYVSRVNNLCLCHSPIQREWIQHKAAHLGIRLRTYAGVENPPTIQGNPRRTPDKGRVMAATRVDRRWRQLFYPQGKKIFIPPPSMKALAVWYCDDGNRHIGKNYVLGAPRFCVHGFSAEDKKLMRIWFEAQFGHKISYNKGDDLLVIGKQARRRFFEAVAPYIPASMGYKLPLCCRGLYNGWLEEAQARWTTIEKITPYCGRGDKSVLYCLTVAHPSHRFFTEAALVANSWHFLQPTLPASLGFATPLLGWNLPPWKYRNQSAPEEYSVIDAHATRFDGMQIEAALRSRGVYNLHERHVVECYEVLTKMAENGLPFDQPAAKEFGEKLTRMKAERELELQSRVPDALKPVKQKTGYKKTPKDLVGLVKRTFLVEWTDLTTLEQTQLVKQEGIIRYEVERWAKLEEFNPGSPKQLLDLIRHYGYRVGTNRKTKKPTTDDETIRKLLRKCREGKEKDREFAKTLEMVRECKQLGKVLSTYVLAWKPKTDGRVHALPGYWGKMFRISWRHPNLSGTVQDKTEGYIAAGFRKCVATTHGRLLVESDFKGIEAVLVGYFANDPDYMRLAKIGIHDYLCCHVLAVKGKILPSDIPSLSLNDGELRKFFKEIKKRFPKDRDDSKHIVHGSNYLATPLLIASMYEMPLAETEHIQEIYFDKVAAKVRGWQHSVLELAHEKVWLQNAFGYRMAFNEIYRWNSKRFESLSHIWAKQTGFDASGSRAILTQPEKEWIKRINEKMQTKGCDLDAAISDMCYDLGDDAKSAISFLPRDTAAAMLKEVLLRLRWLADDGIMLLSNHDAILCEVPEEKLDWIANLLRTEMERPVPQLPLEDGSFLSIETEVKFGRTWDSADDEDEGSMRVYEFPSIFPASNKSTEVVESSGDRAIVTT